MERIYKFNNSFIKVLFGDITNTNAEIIVSSISMAGGVSPIVRKKVTSPILADIDKFVPATLGDVIVTSAGELPNKFIFHVVTIGRKRLSLNKQTATKEANSPLWRFMIENSINKCFRLMHALDMTSIAFPALGGGAAHIPYEEIASNMIRTLSLNLSRTNKSINVELYLYNRYKNRSEWDFIPFFENIGKFLSDKAPINNICIEKAPFTTKLMDATPFVFISYSRKDINKSIKVCEVLKKNTINYWIDEEGKYSGSNFKGVLVEQIRRSSVVLFLSSVNSNQSTNVVKEIGIAVNYLKPIIPIRLDNSFYDVNIEYDLCNIDYIEFDDNKSFYNKMIDSIRVHLESVEKI